MALWVFFALMTGAAVFAVLWPLSRPALAVAPAADDRAFIKDQMAEIERDVSRGLLSPAEKDAAVAEIARRFLRAVGHAPAGAPSQGEPALRRRRAAATFALSMIPLIALAIYGARGSPHLPAVPFAERMANSSRMDIAQAIARIEEHLAKAPEDGRGWEVIAPIYMRLGRADDAVRAYAATLRLLGETPARRADYGEALVAAANGLVTSEALASFRRAAEADPNLPKPQFYLALAAEQDGRRAEALDLYKKLRASAPSDAPWVAMVDARIAGLEGTDQAGAIAAMPADQRNEAIRGMVAGLAARLETNGRDLDGWLRLIRSYTVLGSKEEAEAALAKARTNFAGDQTALARLDALAEDLKRAVTPPAPTP
jgi:cytochrome c-type biogenesis protein CcmH